MSKNETRVTIKLRLFAFKVYIYTASGIEIKLIS